jgi:hypothetical protein
MGISDRSKLPLWQNTFKTLLLLLLCFSFYIPAGAQTDTSEKHIDKIDAVIAPPSKNQTDDSDQKDLIDVFKMAFRKSPRLEKRFFKTDSLQPNDSLLRKSGKLHVSLLPGAGYTLQTRFAGVLAANGAFYTDESEHANLSVVNALVAYTQNQQIIFPIQSNIWTKGNKFNLLGDWRFYKYPQNTYGLGGHTTLADADPLNYTFITLHQTVAKQVAKDLLAGIGYNFDYHWNIQEAGYPDGHLSDFQKYGKTEHSTSTGPSVNLLFDNRRNAIYPLRGTYLNVVYRNNLTFLGSDGNWQSLLIDYRKYFKLPGYKNSVLAFWSYAWLTLAGKPPYLDLPSTAWDTYSNIGRGYIQSRFRGRNLIDVEGEYRFVFTRNGLLGGVVFANAQAVSNYPGNNIDTILPGAGLGLRIKVNKHSNTNVAIDYGWGAGGSNGLFVNLGEVF